MSHPRITVISVSWHSAGFLRACLRAWEINPELAENPLI